MNITQKKQLLEGAIFQACELKFELSNYMTFSNVGKDYFVIDGKKWIKFDSFRRDDVLFHLDKWINRINTIQELIASETTNE
ncbi:MAG: hypothetical protein IPL26_13200 [Leptospiraceae bacterium]|nr:hypothetical protein [Leptospiraceae bacterium]